MYCVRVRLVRRSWLCRKTSSLLAGDLRRHAEDVLTIDPSATAAGRTKLDSELRRRVMRAHALRHEASVRMVKGAAMDILFVATELWPYVKVGGLADVTASQTKALRGLGHKVTLVLPRFPGVREEGGSSWPVASPR